jgi:hypothetical protein
MKTAKKVKTMPQQSTRAKRQIPEFASIEEEAEFWDTHDTADYEEEFRQVEVRFARNLSRGLTVRLDPQTLEELRAQAHRKGIGPTTLARMWILENLRRDRA